MQVRDLPTNVRVYGSKCRHGRNAMTAKRGVRGVGVRLVWDKTPCRVTGTAKRTGLKDTPKDAMKKIGISERGKVRTWSICVQ